jgi:hypothetical protein
MVADTTTYSALPVTLASKDLPDEGRTNIDTEADLAEMWTMLGMELRRLGEEKLGKRCDMKGRYWADPQKFSETFWEDADITLDSVEELAQRLRVETAEAGAIATSQHRRDLYG